jgi:hypothetical protein
MFFFSQLSPAFGGLSVFARPDGSLQAEGLYDIFRQGNGASFGEPHHRDSRAERTQPVA